MYVSSLALTKNEDRQMHGKQLLPLGIFRTIMLDYIIQKPVEQSMVLIMRGKGKENIGVRI